MLNVSVASSMLTSNDDSHAGMYAHASTSTLSRIAWIRIQFSLCTKPQPCCALRSKFIRPSKSYIKRGVCAVMWVTVENKILLSTCCCPSELRLGTSGRASSPVVAAGEV